MTKVELSCASGAKDFTLEHAQAILDYQKVKGFSCWKLTDKDFSLKDGVIIKRDSGADKNAKGDKSTPTSKV